MICSANPRVRLRLGRSAYRGARGFGRGRLFGFWCALQMVFRGRVSRYRVIL